MAVGREQEVQGEEQNSNFGYPHCSKNYPRYVCYEQQFNL